MHVFLSELKTVPKNKPETILLSKDEYDTLPDTFKTMFMTVTLNYCNGRFFFCNNYLRAASKVLGERMVCGIHNLFSELNIDVVYVENDASSIMYRIHNCEFYFLSACKLSGHTKIRFENHMSKNKIKTDEFNFHSRSLIDMCDRLSTDNLFITSHEKVLFVVKFNNCLTENDTCSFENYKYKILWHYGDGYLTYAASNGGKSLTADEAINMLGMDFYLNLFEYHVTLGYEVLYIRDDTTKTIYEIRFIPELYSNITRAIKETGN